MKTGSCVITTPAAWVDVFLGIPSILRAVSISSLILLFSCISVLSSFDFFTASSIVILNSFGTSFATVSTDAYGIPITLPTSRIAALV